MQAHAAGAGLPVGAGGVAAEPCELMPGLSAIRGAEECGILDAGVHRVGVGQGWLKVPDTLELPGVLRAVVPLVRRQRLAGLGGCVVDELVALPHGHPLGSLGGSARGRSGLLPSLAAIAGPLDDLSEPAAGL